MQFNLVAALVAGFAGTIAITFLMIIAPRMGLPEMDMPALLGSLFQVPGNKTVGWLMHFTMGMIFGVVYGLLFTLIPENRLLLGVILGNIYWLIAGFATQFMPLIHVGIKSGSVPAPGIYMINVGGVMGFIGGLVGHVVFGLVVGFVYGILSGSVSG